MLENNFRFFFLNEHFKMGIYDNADVQYHNTEQQSFFVRLELLWITWKLKQKKKKTCLAFVKHEIDGDLCLSFSVFWFFFFINPCSYLFIVCKHMTFRQ